MVGSFHFCVLAAEIGEDLCLFEGIQHLLHLLILRFHTDSNFMHIGQRSNALQKSLNPLLISPRADNINLQLPKPKTWPQKPSPLPIPIRKLLQRLPRILIIADQLGHRHNLIPIVFDLNLLDGMLAEFLECVFHDFYADVVQGERSEVWFFGEFLLED